MEDEALYELRKKYAKEMKVIKNSIYNFTEKERLNFCERCLINKGVEKEFSSKSFETFICDGCGEIREVLNLKIIKLIEEKGISPKEYSNLGGPNIFFNEKFKLWLD